MSKTLQELLTEENNSELDPILKSIYIDKIVINKENNLWDIYLASDIEINDNYIEMIKFKLDEMLKIPGNTNIIFNDRKKELFRLEDLLNREKFINIVKHAFSYNPALACLIQACEYEVEEDGFTIYADNEFSYEILKNKNTEDVLISYLVANYDMEARVRIAKRLCDCSQYELIKEQEEKLLISSRLGGSSLESKSLSDGRIIPMVKKDHGKLNLIYGKKLQGDIVEIASLSEELGAAVICGEVFKTDCRETKSGKIILSLYVTDHTSSITAKLFLKPEVFEEIGSKLKEGAFVKVQGEVINDKFSRELVVIVSAIAEAIPDRRMDTAEDKRVELHLHTQMSSMDGVSSAASLIDRAKEWGHKAIAITDHGVVQAFPEAMEASMRTGVKILYGVEAYLVDDGEPIIFENYGQSLEDEFVVFDIESTGLNKNTDEIIEIGAVKIKNYCITGKFSALVKPERGIPEEITNLTGITNYMVKDMPGIKDILPKFLDFANNLPVVAHNAKFDTGFIKQYSRKLNRVFNNTVIDTLTLSRWLLPDLKKHKLNSITEYLGIKLENLHRAVDDAEATAQVFLKFIHMLKERGAENLKDIDRLYIGNFDVKKAEMYHSIIFAKNLEGLYNLYKLISFSHLDYFHKRPRMPKSLVMQYRDGLIIGSACESGQVYKGVLNNLTDDEMFDLIKFYDYLEIQPRGNNEFLIENGTVENEKRLLELNRRIVELGKKFNKPVAATGDVHFLDPYDECYRRILMAGKGFSDADKQAPLYFKTTEEMLEEFSYLGKDTAREVVIKNTNLIAGWMENIKPIPDETYTPKIDGAEEDIKNMTMKRAHEIYGDPLPEIVQQRLNKELQSIISHGYAVLYLIAQKLVAKSLKDGYLVGSRGSVGSSLVATMCGITEVNALPPHYVCPGCKNSEFFTDGTIGSGFDLPEKICPVCGEIFDKNGSDIPFETFLGFDGDKEPDIDLNFSGDYQSVAHKYTEELFGEGHTFRAGTIGTIAQKTAYGFVKNYLDERNIKVNQAEIERLVKGCTGVKRTSGQHPGGIMVVPKDKEIFQFCPVQRPADDPDTDVVTTHFDYHSISGRLLKLDILGHDDPTVIRMLQTLTGVEPTRIPLGDEKVLELFTSTKPLGVTPEEIDCETGTLGIPEFGTKFVRQMLLETQPGTFMDLVRISGLSHGTDVWINNAQELIKNGTATLKEVIPTRDDIMVYLMYKGLWPKSAFTIMERVRKGKGLREEDIVEMKEHDVPQWYIDSCNKIKYMFPKGHAVAYVTMALRIAWFKVYYPEAYYATYFTVRADDFDADLIVRGERAVKQRMKEIEALGNSATQKDKGLMTVLEISYEMYKRGFKFCQVDLYKSDAVKFRIIEDGILPPFKALQGVGENAARNIVKAREEGIFLSKEDLRLRSKVSKTVLELMTNHGCLKDLPDTNQLSLF